MSRGRFQPRYKSNEFSKKELNPCQLGGPAYIEQLAVNIGSKSLAACCFSRGLADNCIVAKVNNAVWDLDRPLEEDCSLQLLKFDDDEAQVTAVYGFGAFVFVTVLCVLV